jgi:hypothetical protein
MTERAHVFVGIPSRYPIEVETCKAIVALQAGLAAAGLGSTICFEDVSGLVLARNLLAGRFRAHPRATHLLCVDSDVSGFFTEDVLRMIGADVGVIGAPLPSRVLSPSWLAMIAKARAEGVPEGELHHYRSELLMQVETGTWTVRGEALRVDWMGTGFLLIRRDALERVIAHLEALARDGQAPSPVANIPSHGDVVNVFDYLIDGTGQFVGEDVGFCLRAREAGLEIWADTRAALWHLGREIWTAPPLNQALGITKARARAALTQASTAARSTTPDGSADSTPLPSTAPER